MISGTVVSHLASVALGKVAQRVHVSTGAGHHSLSFSHHIASGSARARSHRASRPAVGWEGGWLVHQAVILHQASPGGCSDSKGQVKMYIYVSAFVLFANPVPSARASHRSNDARGRAGDPAKTDGKGQGLRQPVQLACCGWLAVWGFNNRVNSAAFSCYGTD